MARRDRFDARAAKHRPCPACKGRRGAARPHPWAGVPTVDGSPMVPAGATRWHDCDRCRGAGTLTRLCPACDGTGGGVAVRRTDVWSTCDVCMGTGRATARGTPPAARRLTAAELDELEVFGDIAPPQGPTSPLPPNAKSDVGTGNKPDAPGAAGGPGVRRCRRGGGLHCARPTVDLCETCALVAL